MLCYYCNHTNYNERCVLLQDAGGKRYINLSELKPDDRFSNNVNDTEGQTNRKKFVELRFDTPIIQFIFWGYGTYNLAYQVIPFKSLVLIDMFFLLIYATLVYNVVIVLLSHVSYWLNITGGVRQLLTCVYLL